MTNTMSNPFDLTGKVAVVTGASAGIGQGLAEALAQAGADIVGVARSDVDETRQMVEAAGRKFLAIKADLGGIEPIQGIIDSAVTWSGHVDILINNAGIIRRNDAIDFSEKDWDDVLNVNLKSVFFLSQAFARQTLKREGPGKIINIASMLSFQGGIRVPSYTASKSGIAGLTRLCACEWAGKGINVNAIAPGYFATANTRQLRDDPDRSRAILERIPANRWGTPADLGGAAVFLSSRASDYVHGIILPVDGGWLVR
jgi:2-deoxy-D-gluconate 3-dehydrogenase